MLDDRELLRAHVEALFAVDDAGRLIRVNDPGGEVAPRFFIGWMAQGSACWFRNDITDDIVQMLRETCATVPDGMETEPSMDRAVAFEAVLQQSAPVRATWSGPAFHCPDSLQAGSSSVSITQTNVHILRPHLSGWCEDVVDGKTLVAVLVDGLAVSVCVSVRESNVAHEAGVETAKAFRGQGFAAQAVSAWAEAVRRQHRVPLYSTSWANVASRALARKLGLVQFASDLHVT